MKTQNKVTIALVILILLLIGGGWIYINSLKQDIADAELSARIEKLRADKLEIISTTQARKLVADSLTQKQLNQRVKELGIELDAKPKIVWKTKFIIKEVEKEVDSVKVDSNSLEVIDYYPAKENYFIRYQNKIDLINGKGNSKWNFKPIVISGAISKRDDGIYQVDFVHPDFLQIDSIDIEATPLDTPKPDNFGVLFGASYGKDFKDDTSYLRLSGGLRFKRFYIDVGGGTNSTIDGGVKYEF